MNYWLMKNEPEDYSIDDLARDKVEPWDGIRNYQVRNMIRDVMKVGDLAFFYHSVNEKQIVGIVEVCTLYHPDPTDASGRFGMVTVKAVKSLHIPVTLIDIKADKRLQDMALVRQSRLSVTPVTAEHWDIIMDKSQTKL